MADKFDHRILFDEFLRPDAKILFVTGAGISVASGIPPFRGTDPDAVWNKSVTTKGTFKFFQRHPDLSWKWYLETFTPYLNSQPNPAHTAITEIETWLEGRGGKCNVITQNVDGLHGKAGTKNVIECHGTLRHLRCTEFGCEFGPPQGTLDFDWKFFDEFKANPCVETVPKCPSCGHLLRPHTLLFDESYSGHESYGLELIDDLMDEMTALIFVGTSFAVTITDLLMMSAYQRAIPTFNVDPNAECIAEFHHIQDKAEEFLPRLVKAL